MKGLLWIAVLFLISAPTVAQQLEVSPLPESFKGYVGEAVEVPLRVKNISDKPVTIVLRKTESQLGSTQRSYFCLSNDCLERRDEIVLKLDPGQTTEHFLNIEAGLVPTTHSGTLKLIVINKNNPLELHDLTVNLTVDERTKRKDVFTSRFITLYDIYPNPVSEFAYIDYKILDERVKANIRIHNILGNSLSNYALDPQDNKLKISASDLHEGIYFYTLYVDEEGLVTRKFVVKK